MKTEQVVILDSEVFVFDNWDESRFYDPATKQPRLFYWVPSERKPEWDYKMYQGAAYLLSFLPECKDVMTYANSTEYHRHISGVVLFSTRNVAELWRRLEADTNLAENIDDLFNRRDDLAFSDHDIYGIATEYGLFDSVVPTVPHDDLLGWYENQTDPKTEAFKPNAMWSMCQRYYDFPTAGEYRQYMQATAAALSKQLPTLPYWNEADRELIDLSFDSQPGIAYFKKYEKQLNFTFRRRYSTMSKALELLTQTEGDKTIVEVGTLRDNTKGGGHSTYKFGEFCARFGGKVHTVDILPDAIAFAQKATAQYQAWIDYHVADSSQFLAGFDGTIDMLYLDGLDSNEGQEEVASQKQLDEIKVALPKLAPKAVVLLDDANLPHGGKTRYSSTFLQKHGFVLVVDDYQKLYARGFDRLAQPRTKLWHKIRDNLIVGQTTPKK